MKNITITLNADPLSKHIVMNFDFITIIEYRATDFSLRAMTKKEYSRRSGIPERTLRNYLNNRYFSELEKIGYAKNQRKLSAHIVSYLDYLLVITPNEGQ